MNVWRKMEIGDVDADAKHAENVCRKVFSENSSCNPPEGDAIRPSLAPGTESIKTKL
jgi:hypothetical protein